MVTDFNPLFEYLDEFKGEVSQRFDKLESKVDILQTSVDGLAKKVQDIGGEHIVLKHRVEILETKVG